MSYARWSNSAWYAFYNVNGKLSLWYDMDHCIDIDYEDCKEINEEQLIQVYGCTQQEAEEAMKYIAYFVEDYDPEVKESFKKEIKELMDKWEEE